MTQVTPSAAGPSDTRSAGHAIVEQLVALGAQRAYLVPGESFLDVLDGMHGSRLDAVVCRQEGGAGFMALAEGRLTGAPGIVMVTRGPGAANAAIAVHTAYQDATPLLLLVGLIPVADRDRDSFQEFDPRAWFGSTAKKVVVLDDPARAPETIRDAWHLAVSGRPGPVVVGLPEDLLPQPCDLPTQPARTAPVAACDPQPVLDVIAAGSRPVIVVGGDGFSAEGSADLRRFAESWELSVVSDFRADDKLDHASPSWCGHLGYGRTEAAAGLLEDADVVVLVGCPRGDVLTDGYRIGMRPRVTALVLPDPDLVAHAGDADVHLLAMPDAFCAAAAAVAAPADRPWAERTRRGHEAYEQEVAAHADGATRGVDLGVVMGRLAERLEPDAIVTFGAGNHAIWAQRYLPHHSCPSVLAPRNGAMGFGVPAAVAATLVDPGRRVVTVAGDGCFLMNGQELAVAAARGSRLLALVVDNGQFGTIREHQEAHYPGRVSGTQLANPDFAALAEAHGGLGLRATTTQEALDALEKALAHEGLALVHLVTDPAILGPR